ncbi:unnamed protein product, partial [marine sediment metagenome]
PFSKIISELGAPKVMVNNVSLGTSVALINYDLEILKNVIKDIFVRKGSEIVDLNIKSSELGYKYVKEKLKINIYELEIVKPVSKSKDIDGEYRRYFNTDDGISPRVVTGIEGGIHIANSDEHNEDGYSEECAHNRKIMVDKRFRKINKLIIADMTKATKKIFFNAIPLTNL